MDSNNEKSDSEIQNVLDTVDGECHFFRSLMRTRPVGINRFFHVMAMKAAIERGVQQEVSIEDIWRKLESCYNLDQLEHLEAEYENNANSSSSSTPQPTPSPKPNQNLAIHPWFRSEFILPTDRYIEELMATRRVRSTPSPPSTPEPPVRVPGRRGRKRKVDKIEPEPERERPTPKSGDSDISELTQQSGDEGEAGAPTPSDRRAASVATGTEAGTEEPEEEEEDKTEDAPKERKKPGRKPGRGRGGRRGRRKKQ